MEYGDMVELLHMYIGNGVKKICESQMSHWVMENQKFKRWRLLPSS